MKSCLTILFVVFSLSPTIIFAQELSNSEIKLELNPTPKTEKQKQDQIKIYNTVSNNINAQENVTKGDKYTVTIPYFEKSNKLPLGISLSTENINFGIVTSGEPILRTQTLSVFSKSKKGYSVFTAVDHGLTSASNTQIPNTSCDSGSCTSILSDKWELPLTYGFGYTCENRETCNKSFEGGLYRRFSSLESKESYAVIINGTTNTETNITYKLNVPPTQSQEPYQNTVYYILAPQF